MAKLGAGLLLFRRIDRHLELFLVHPGGPFWARKDDGAWSLPKGEYGQEEDALLAARREFHEETGISVDGEFLPLGEIKQSGGKLVTAWAIEGEIDSNAVKSKLFSMEWPPRSGHVKYFPEADRGGWFAAGDAITKIVKGQRPMLDRFLERMRSS